MESEDTVSSMQRITSTSVGVNENYLDEFH